MVRYFSRVGVVVLVAVALACPVVEAGGGEQVRKAWGILSTGVKKLTDHGAAVVTIGAVVISLCTGLSCERIDDYQMHRVLVASDNIVGTFPIMQGATNASQTQMFVLTDASSDYLFSLVDGKGGKVSPTETDMRSHPSSTRAMRRVFFDGLQANKPYLFQVHAASTGELMDERELQTLASHQQDLCFAFASCMWDLWDQGDIWEQMVALDPDVIFLVGDNVYADLPRPAASSADLWTRYVETREKLSLFRNRKLIPVVSTWDDHDYGKNNSDRNFALKNDARKVFEAFFISSNRTMNFHAAGIGVANSFAAYGYNFFLMDNRTFRTAVGESPERHFGDTQLQWLLHSLQGLDHAFIASGSQFFGGYSHINNVDNDPFQDESFQGDHPKRFEYFIDQLHATGTKVVFLSGDRHYSEVMAIPQDTLGYQTYELTSSPASMFSSPFPDIPNPLRVAGNDSDTNFMLVELKETGEGLIMQVSAHSVGGNVLFRGTYTVE